MFTPPSQPSAPSSSASPSSCSASTSASSSTLTDEQRASIAQKRAEAIRRREERKAVAARPTQSPHAAGKVTATAGATTAGTRGGKRAAASSTLVQSTGKAVVYKPSNYFVDTNAGFILPDDDDDTDKGGGGKSEGRKADPRRAPPRPVVDRVLQPEGVPCTECGQVIHIETYLQKSFGADVCDGCRAMHEKFELITKTDAKKDFLLTDADFRSLRFIEKRNPHKSSWSQMKLYLLAQVEDIAFTRYGGAQGLDDEYERREAEREQKRHFAYEKKLKALKRVVTMPVERNITSGHKHEFDKKGETFDAEAGMWKKVCTTCGFEKHYERL